MADNRVTPKYTVKVDHFQLRTAKVGNLLSGTVSIHHVFSVFLLYFLQLDIWTQRPTSKYSYFQNYTVDFRECHKKETIGSVSLVNPESLECENSRSKQTSCTYCPLFKINSYYSFSSLTTFPTILKFQSNHSIFEHSKISKTNLTYLYSSSYLNIFHSTFLPPVLSFTKIFSTLKFTTHFFYSEFRIPPHSKSNNHTFLRLYLDT